MPPRALSGQITGTSSMFALDRDLLIHEPSLFRLVSWNAQRLFRGIVSITGTLLTAAPDVNFSALGVTSGHVVVIASTPYEVTGVAGANRLTVSRLRPLRAGPLVAPPAATAVEATIDTFSHQINAAQEALLQQVKDLPAGAKLLVSAALIHLVALRALRLILSAADTSQSSVALRLELLNRLADRLALRACFEIDLDGDGRAELFRPVAMHDMTRG
jgi:hypothetical protein